MYTQDVLQNIKEMPITAYLQSLGILPVKATGKELVYYSPRSNESTPSFMVDPAKNVFHDFSGEGEKGDIIRMVRYLNGCSFVDAVKTLQTFKGDSENLPFSFSGQNSTVAKKSAVEVIRVQPLRNKALLDYVSSRKISVDVATTHLQEVYYRINQKQYYAIGFCNDKGGYELRSQYFKGCTSPKWFKLITGQKNDAINLFEGVFDFLSCCERFNTTRLNYPTVVLNSLAFLSEVLPVLETYPVVNAFFDNDKAGKLAIDRLRREGINIQDCSHYYPNCKDFNDYLMQAYSP